MNITPNKLTIAQLLATPNEQFVVPSYQRRYAWGPGQYKALYEDIDMLKDNDGHLFGTIILHSDQHTGGLNKPELVDGQQRLTTLIILLKAFEMVYREKGNEEKANEARKMIICKGLDEIARSKLQLGELDNADIEQLVLQGKTDHFTNKKVRSAFEDYYHWLSQREMPELNRYFFKLTNVAVLIRLDVGAAQDAYKLFETINNRGLRLSATDIIKNFLLGHAAKINDLQILEDVKRLWSGIIMNLDDIDTDDFLRQFICSTLHRKVSWTKLVQEFKKYYLNHVEHGDLLGEFEYFLDDPNPDEDEQEEDLDDNNNNGNGSLDNGKKFTIVEFLEHLEQLSDTYRKIYFGTHENHKINRRIRNLNNIKSRPTYIFLMHYLHHEAYSSRHKEKLLEYFESLMLRRHICERRTAENDQIFSKIVPMIGSEDLLSQVKQYMEDNEFIPGDPEFELSFPKHQFKGRLINRAKYVLESIEEHLRGNTKELVVSSSEEVHLEHIIPQTINTKKAKQEYGDWVSYLGNNSVAKHNKYVNYIGNMTLLGEALNIQAYNNPFAKKKGSYRKSSFLLTKELADQQDFKFYHVDKRSEDLTALALKIWKT